MTVLYGDTFSRNDGAISLTDGGGVLDPVAWSVQPSAAVPRPLPVIVSREVSSFQFSAVGVSGTHPIAGPRTTQGLLFTGAGVLDWISMRERGGIFPGIVRVWDGLGPGSVPLLWDVSVLPGRSREDAAGKFFSTGLYLEVLSGQIEVSFGTFSLSSTSEGVLSVPVNNYSVEITVRTIGSGTSRAVLRARTSYNGSGQASGYAAYALGSNLFLATVANDVFTTIVGPIPYVVGDKFGLSVNGSSISLLHNGQGVGTVVNATYSAGGRTAIYLENDVIPWTLDNFVLKSGALTIDHITYSEIDRRTWFLQPNFVRWRHRFRGPRESYKLNEEISSFLFEVRQNYETQALVRETLAANLANLVGGVDLPPTVDITIPGYGDIISRIESLRARIKVLENKQ